jgi:hypothetical protein
VEITGRCWWCKREDTERHLGTIGVEECVDVEECKKRVEEAVKKEWEATE